ncbi:MAG: hypothetical protein EOP00_22940 [Pedobacter sp.]|nr:MAG: hypothetical protein EOP00_22940 [Pedobacter sp.]
MNFLFAKVYEEFKRQAQVNATFQVTSFIGIVFFLFGIIAYLILSEILNLRIYTGLLIITTLTISLGLAYFGYIKNHKIDVLENKFKDKKINRTVLYLIMIFLPILLLLIGASLITILKGGIILSYQF